MAHPKQTATKPCHDRIDKRKPGKLRRSDRIAAKVKAQLAASSSSAAAHDLPETVVIPQGLVSLYLVENSVDLVKDSGDKKTVYQIRTVWNGDGPPGRHKAVHEVVHLAAVVHRFWNTYFIGARQGMREESRDIASKVNKKQNTLNPSS